MNLTILGLLGTVLGCCALAACSQRTAPNEPPNTDTSDAGGVVGVEDASPDAGRDIEGTDAAQGPSCTPESCNGNGTCSVVEDAISCECEDRFEGDDCASCTAPYTGTDCADCKDGMHLDIDGVCVPNLCGPETSRVLFIGNSYTSANNLPMLYQSLASSLGCQVEVDSSLIALASFGGHLGNTGTMDKINLGNWDHVILQNQSQIPSFLPEDVRSGSLTHAVSLAGSIRAANEGVKITYFQTWGRRDGDALNCNYYPLVCTYAGHTQALGEGYAIYESETGDEIAPVGFAWRLVVNDTTPAPFDTDLLWLDDSLPTLRGSYLAALTIFARTFLRSPLGAFYEGGLSNGDARYLQAIAAPYSNVCGDGVVNTPEEECDDSGESATCNANCTTRSCGDGITNITAGEACDDSGESADCNDDCSVQSCGDGIINATALEDCDDQGESMSCDDNCTSASCGDGDVNATRTEECDDGNVLDNDYCDSTCKYEADDGFDDDTPGTATLITPGRTWITGHTIVGSDDVDYFYFNAEANAEYIAWTGNLACGTAPNADTLLSFFSGDGTIPRGMNDNYNVNLCSAVLLQPTVAETIYVAVRGQTLGDYQLQVFKFEDDIYAGNDSAANAYSLPALPVTLNDLVQIGNTQDWFSFIPTTGQTYRLRIRNHDCRPGDSSDLAIWLYRDGTGIEQGYSDENGSGTCADLEYIALGPELIRIRIDFGTRAELSYSLEVTEL